MKTLSVLIATFVMPLASFTTIPAESTLEYEVNETANQIVKALQQQSVDAYVELFPSLNEFHEVMDNHKNIYGDLLEEAKADLAHEYITELIPAVHENFQQQLALGKNRNISWAKIQLKETTLKQATDGSLIITMHCEADGKKFAIQLTNAMRLHGKVKVSQKLVLV